MPPVMSVPVHAWSTSGEADERTPGSLLLRVEADGVDEEELDGLTRSLLAELNDSDLAVASVVSSPAPAATKAADAAVLGTLLVQVVPQALTGLVSILRSWSRRRAHSTVKIRATGAAGSVDIEYPAGEMSQQELKSLVAKLARSMASPPVAG